MIKVLDGKQSVKIIYSFAQRRTGDVVSAYADTTKANTVLGWKSESTLEDAIFTVWELKKSLRKIKLLFFIKPKFIVSRVLF